MTADEVRATLAGRGVRLIADGDTLRWEAPAGVVTADVIGALREHKPALLGMLAAERMGANAKPVHATPSACLAPLVCGVVGLCGRLRCIPPEQRGRFMETARIARQPDNPHRVPDFDEAAGHTP